jgi:hypothetical protein
VVAEPGQEEFVGIGEGTGNLLVDGGTESAQRYVELGLAGDGTRAAAVTAPQVDHKRQSWCFTPGRIGFACRHKAYRSGERSSTRTFEHLPSGNGQLFMHDNLLFLTLLLLIFFEIIDHILKTV